MRYHIVLALSLALISAGCGGSNRLPPPHQLTFPTFLYVTNGAPGTISGFTLDYHPVPGSPFASQGATPMGITSFGPFVYVANRGSGSISGYSFDPKTGALTPVSGSPFPALAGVRSFAKCFGQSLYVVAESGSISGYFPQPSGELVPIPGSPWLAGTRPQTAAIDASCKFAFVANAGSNNVSAFSINITTGALTPVPGSPFPAGIDPSSLVVEGKFLYVINAGSNDISAFAIDANTGKLTPVPGSPFGAGQAPSSVTVLISLYVANAGSNDISAYNIDTTTGALTPVGGSPFPAGRQPRWATIGGQSFRDLPDQPFVHVANGLSNDISVYRTDHASGALISLPGSPFPAGTDPQSVVIATAPE